jgi:TPR repeat protein
VKRSTRVAAAAALRAETNLARFQRLAGMTRAELEEALGGDPRVAEPWIRAAATHGVVEAQVRLAAMLLDGIGAEAAPDAAYRWFLRAAHNGHAEAMNMVGRCHENGWGVPADDGKAVLWYRRSALAGHAWGEYNYGHMLFDGRGGIAKDRRAAFAYYRRAAERGHARAMNLAARCLEAGWGIASDKAQAAHWYRRSAKAGYFRAQYNHAAILAERGDLPDAIEWLEKAHRDGDVAMRDRACKALADVNALSGSRTLRHRP